MEAHAKTFPEFAQRQSKHDAVRFLRWDGIMQRQAREEREWEEARPRIRKLRQDLDKALGRLGFKHERDKGGSTYYAYHKGLLEFRVRVSDHEVPMTPERQYNADRGGFTWADQGWNFVIDASTEWRDILEDLVRLRKSMRKAAEGLNEVLKQGESHHSAKDRKAITSLRTSDYPATAEDGKGYCFHWADGRGVCGFKHKSDALSWLETPRDVVRYWYGAPVIGSKKTRFKVSTSYKKSTSEGHWSRLVSS